MALTALGFFDVERERKTEPETALDIGVELQGDGSNSRLMGRAHTRPATMLPKIPTQLLLLDGIGAVVTAAAMALLLAPLEGLFGLPAPTAYFLAALGALFACYSLSGALRGASQSSTRLRNIAIANFGYSALSLVLVVHHRDVLTPFGYAYLGVEIALVTALANYELTVARLCAKL